MKNFDRDELQEEIRRVSIAMEKTDSVYLKRDYGKYLKRLNRELIYYDKHFNGAKSN